MTIEPNFLDVILMDIIIVKAKMFNLWNLYAVEESPLSLSLSLALSLSVSLSVLDQSNS